MADGTVQLYFGRNYGGIGIMVYGSVFSHDNCPGSAQGV